VKTRRHKHNRSELEIVESEGEKQLNDSNQAALKKPDIDVATMTASKTKRPEVIESLRQAIKPIELIHDDPPTRPGLFVARTGILGDQLGVYAEKDIIVGHSARKLISYYAGEFQEELAETMDSNHYVFEHDEGGAIDGTYVRNWSAYINHF
jgi:hypothetical protein